MPGMSAPEQPVLLTFPYWQAAAPLHNEVFKDCELKPACAALAVFLNVAQEKLML